jgi:N6-L-threonylcarbamoyladenine synthase
LLATGVKQLVVAGGVGANLTLRAALGTMAQKIDAALFFPRLEYCTDNAAMIALTGYLRLKAGQCDDLTIKARARWPLDELTAITS